MMKINHNNTECNWRVQINQEKSTEGMARSKEVCMAEDRKSEDLEFEEEIEYRLNWLWFKWVYL